MSTHIWVGVTRGRAGENQGGAPDRRAPDPAPGDTGGVRERPSTLMYLPPELSEELEVAKVRLKARARSEGRTLSLNGELYPALVRVALDNLEDVRRELDLEGGP